MTHLPCDCRRTAAPGRASAPLLLAAVFILATTDAIAVAPEEPIQPLPRPAAQDPKRVALGRLLFKDTRLSANGRVSCASCHDLARGGADGRATSTGFSGASSGVNTPTVLNAALNFKQFWNGRADSLEQQIDHVVRSPVEMGSTWPDVVGRIDADASYRSAFAAAYKDGVSKTSITDALATYERTLTTPGSRFDRFLQGDSTAISATEKAGYAAFKSYGCASCHQGVNIGGNMFQKFGTMDDYFASRGNPQPADLGRFAVTGDVRDKHVFKVPGLRNIALTAPYFHDASAKTLEDAVGVMFRFQLGRVASQEERASIVSFLKTLTGELGAPP